MERTFDELYDNGLFAITNILNKKSYKDITKEDLIENSDLIATHVYRKIGMKLENEESGNTPLVNRLFDNSKLKKTGKHGVKLEDIIKHFKTECFIKTEKPSKTRCMFCGEYTINTNKKNKPRAKVSKSYYYKSCSIQSANFASCQNGINICPICIGIILCGVINAEPTVQINYFSKDEEDDDNNKKKKKKKYDPYQYTNYATLLNTDNDEYMARLTKRMEKKYAEYNPELKNGAVKKNENINTIIQNTIKDIELYDLNYLTIKKINNPNQVKPNTLVDEEICFLHKDLDYLKELNSYGLLKVLFDITKIYNQDDFDKFKQNYMYYFIDFINHNFKEIRLINDNEEFMKFYKITDRGFNKMDNETKELVDDFIRQVLNIKDLNKIFKHMDKIKNYRDYQETINYFLKDIKGNKSKYNKVFNIDKKIYKYAITEMNFILISEGEDKNDEQ